MAMEKQPKRQATSNLAPNDTILQQDLKSKFCRSCFSENRSPNVVCNPCGHASFRWIPAIKRCHKNFDHLLIERDLIEGHCARCCAMRILVLRCGKCEIDICTTCIQDLHEKVLKGPCTGQHSPKEELDEIEIPSEARIIMDMANNIRSCPEKYAKLVEHWISQGGRNGENTFVVRHKEQTLIFSSQTVLEELLEFLVNQKPIHKLNNNTHLCVIAQKQALDRFQNRDFLGPNSTHYSSDGCELMGRACEYLKCDENGNADGYWIMESILIANIDPQLVPLWFAVDDCVESRSHRTALFEKRSRFMGVGYVESGGDCFVVMLSTNNMNPRL